MIFKRFVNLLAFLFLLGAGLLTFFLILSGGRESGTLKNFYWLQADTNGFNSAPSTTRWYNYNWCGYEDGQLANCSSRAPAKPFFPETILVTLSIYHRRSETTGIPTIIYPGLDGPCC